MRRKISAAALPILVGLVAVVPETPMVGDPVARPRRLFGSLRSSSCGSLRFDRPSEGHGRSLEMRHKLVAIVASALALSLFGTPVAMAVAPSNDDFASATSVPEPLPFTDAVDTIDATSDVTDPVPSCVETSHTVWYSFTPSATTFVQADTFGSDYDTTLSVWTGTEGSLSELVCNDDSQGSFQSRVPFEAVGGTTYHIMAGSFFDSPGGSLTLNVDVAPPPTLLDALSIDPIGRVKTRTGQVTLSGTVTCSGIPGPVFIDAFLQQRKGRALISGFGFVEIEECSGETPWSAVILGENGLFTGGKATADVGAFSFDDGIFESSAVRLRGGRP